MFFLAFGKRLSEIHVNGKSGPTHLISKLERVIQLGEFELVELRSVRIEISHLFLKQKKHLFTTTEQN